MTRVLTHMCMSLDGFVARPDDDPAELFEWYWTGDVVVPSAQESMSFSVDAASAPMLRELTSGCGAIVAGRRQFPDHHFYDARDIVELAAVARKRGLTLVTTEKDYVRLAFDQRAGVRALPVTLRFEAPERVAHALAAALADRRLNARSTP